MLWELVHVFFDHRGLLEGRDGAQVHDSGASSFLYPFLGETETDLEAVVGDVRALGAGEVGGGRRAPRARRSPTTATSSSPTAVALRELLDAGGRVLACGNGGSATDAMDLVADLRAPRQAHRPDRRTPRS